MKNLIYSNDLPLKDKMVICDKLERLYHGAQDDYEDIYILKDLVRIIKYEGGILSEKQISQVNHALKYKLKLFLQKMFIL